MHYMNEHFKVTVFFSFFIFIHLSMFATFAYTLQVSSTDDFNKISLVHEQVD